VYFFVFFNARFTSFLILSKFSGQHDSNQCIVDVPTFCEAPATDEECFPLGCCTPAGSAVVVAAPGVLLLAGALLLAPG
jgi:hypothetical protein